jgi:hypothetical protein
MIYANMSNSELFGTFSEPGSLSTGDPYKKQQGQAQQYCCTCSSAMPVSYVDSVYMHRHGLQRYNVLHIAV